MTSTSIDKLLRVARLTLIAATMRSAGVRLAPDWWDWPRRSNNDRDAEPRQALKETAPAAGFVKMEHVTEAGAEWGKSAWASNGA